MTRHVIDTGRGKLSWEQLGDGPDLVILHSLLTDRHAFAPVVEEMARHRTVSLVDLPGFGESTPVGPDIDSYADAVGGFLAARDLHPGDTTLVGNGLGALIALGTAIRHGDRFHRLCLVGCGATFPEDARATFEAMAARVEEGGMEAVVDVAVRRIFPDSFLADNPRMAEQRRDVLLGADPAAFVTACGALSRVDYRSRADAIANPTLIVVGSDDAATPPAMAAELAALIPGSALVEMEGVGHAPQLQDPEGFIRAVGGFALDRE